MSKITRFDVYGNANYSDRGTLVLYDHHKEVVEDLERQLAEAREEIQDLKNIGNMFKCFVPVNIADLYNEQLKEQGE